MRKTIPLIALLLALFALPAHAQTWDRDAVYAAREAELKARIAARPDDADACVDLAAFYLKPLAPRQIAAADGQVRQVMVPLRNEWTGPIKNIVAVSWVFRGDPEKAKPLLEQALKLNPRHARAHREMAMLYRMTGDLDRMKPYMEAYLRHDPMDLDMCRLYLDHRTALARVLNDQAAQLRASRTWEETRTDGKVYEVTRSPSPADYAEANRLDQQAQQVRREAIKPMQTLAGALKDDPQVDTDPAKGARWRLATAIYFAWIGELDKSAGTAAAGLRHDPTALDNLDYVVDIFRLTHTRDKLEEYKAILDRWGGADSTPIIVREAPRGPRR